MNDMGRTRRHQPPLTINDSSGRLTVDSRAAREFGAITAWGLPKVAGERILVNYKFSNSLIQINFLESITGNGTIVTGLPNNVSITSGTTVSTDTTITTKQVHKHPVGKGVIGRYFIQFNDAPIAGNIRCFGLYNDNDGYFIQLGDTGYDFVTRKAGVDTLIPASIWDVHVLPDLNKNMWYVQSEGQGVGDYEIWFNEQLVHRVQNLGNLTTSQLNTTDLPLRLENTNTTNTTDVEMNSDGVSVSIEGEESVIVTDGDKNISINSSRRLNTQSGFSYLMRQDMDETLDLIKIWLETVVAGGSFSQPINTFTTFLNVGVGATDLISLKSRLTGLRAGTEEFAVFATGLSFGTNNPANHIKEWGYLDSVDLNGVFFRLNGGIFQFVTVKGGIETVTDLNQVKPNANFHNFSIEQQGAGKIIGIIRNESGVVVDFSPAADSIVGSGEKQPFVKSYNVGVPASPPDDMEVHFIVLKDLSGSAFSIRGKDSENVDRDVVVTSAGNLAVSLEATPVSDINVVEDSVQAGTVDFATLVPNTQTWVIKGLTGGTETSNSGAVISLFIDPLGTGIEANYLLINRIYVNGATGSTTLSTSVTGDGIKTVVIQRRQFGGGNFLTTAVYAADII